MIKRLLVLLFLISSIAFGSELERSSYIYENKDGQIIKADLAVSSKQILLCFIPMLRSFNTLDDTLSIHAPLGTDSNQNALIISNQVLTILEDMGYKCSELNLYQNQDIYYMYTVFNK